MSADPIVYCLEHLTDYRQFERLCSDVMSQSGYPNIEPLGGTGDRGRDALHVSRMNPEDVTILAYSVRGDWQQKLLNEDCTRIRDEGHRLNRLVFVSTSTITAAQHDKAQQQVREDFGWELELYDLERLRVRLVGDLRHLLAQHPAIFCPPFFPRRGGLSVAESRDTLVIDHSLSDHALATWLARRLQLAGYRTWCFGTAPLAGQAADDSIRSLLDQRALRYLPILSRSSVGEADFLGRCAQACSLEDLMVPCRVGAFDHTRLPSRVRALEDVPFTDGWSAGLKLLLEALDSDGIVPDLSRDQGRAVAIRSYLPEPLTRPVPETVYTNTFPVTVPAAIKVCQLARDLSREEKEKLRDSWPFVEASSRTLLCFHDPPEGLPLVPTPRLGEYSWRHYAYHHHKRSADVVKELVRRSMAVACLRAGFRWCDHRRVFYLPQTNEIHATVPFTHVDGRKTRVTLTGEKTQGSGERGTRFRYQLCPKFRVGFDEQERCWLTAGIYIRITNAEGIPYEKKAITRRRKTVARSWWNKEWLARTLGLMQAISEGASEIRIGSPNREVVVCCRPLQWDCPISIDYRAVERLGDFQTEMAQLRFSGDEDDADEDEPGDLEEAEAGE